jgi:hypothetical protein
LRPKRKFGSQFSMTGVGALASFGRLERMAAFHPICDIQTAVANDCFGSKCEVVLRVDHVRLDADSGSFLEGVRRTVIRSLQQPGWQPDYRCAGRDAADRYVCFARVATMGQAGGSRHRPEMTTPNIIYSVSLSWCALKSLLAFREFATWPGNIEFHLGTDMPSPCDGQHCVRHWRRTPMHRCRIDEQRAFGVKGASAYSVRKSGANGCFPPFPEVRLRVLDNGSRPKAEINHPASPFHLPQSVKARRTSRSLTFRIDLRPRTPVRKRT